MNYSIKRALFMGAIMLPCMIIANMLGYDPNKVGVVVAAITSGASVVLFPKDDVNKSSKNSSENSDRS